MNTPRILFVILLLVGALSGPKYASAQGETHVTLQGQLVCSSCWFEADRTKVRYGDDGDLKCAKRCVRNAIPGALAVSEGGATSLFILEDGQVSLSKEGKDWSDRAGKQVEITGTVHKDGEKRFLRVDSLRVLPVGPAT